MDLLGHVTWWRADVSLGAGRPRAGAHLVRSTVVIMRFGPEQALAEIERHRCSSTFMAPTLLKRIVDLPPAVRARYDVSSMRAIIMAAAPCPMSVKEGVVAYFGPALYEFYGSSELGVNTILRPEDVLRKPGSCGRAAPGKEIALLDDDGRPVPAGEPGELHVRRCPGLLDEYYRDPEATARMQRGEWYTVGDVAYADTDGFYYICDRKRDMIISAGVNIYPAEIEDVLHRHPRVLDAAVFGVPDDEWGERVHAALHVRPGARSPAGVTAFCREHMAGYKVRGSPSTSSARRVWANSQSSAPRALLGGPRRAVVTMGRFRARLTAKITVVIVLVLVIGFGVSTILTIQRESALLVEQNKMAARQLIGTLVASIETAMLSERPDITRGLIDDLSRTILVTGLVVCQRNGVEAFTDLATLREVSEGRSCPRGSWPPSRVRREPGRTMAGRSSPARSRPTRPRGARVAGPRRPSPSTSRSPTRALPGLPARTAGARGHPGGHLDGAGHGGGAAAAQSPDHDRPGDDPGRGGGAGGGAAPGGRAPDPRARGGGPPHRGRRLRGAGPGRRGRRGGRAGRRAERHDRGPGPAPRTAPLRSVLAPALENLQASRQRLDALEQLKGELSKFVPDAVKDLLERDPTATSLEKRNEEVSVLFLDIAGYTRLSETVDAKRLNQLIQTYFSSFLEIIRHHHGDVNETAGDGLMVIFQSKRRGESSGDEDHALNATRAAFAIRQRTAALNEEYAGVFPSVALHMGIHTGPALVGAPKLGGAGSQRWPFTALTPRLRHSFPHRPKAFAGSGGGESSACRGSSQP